MNKNLLENDELPASKPMYQELFGEGNSEDIDQKQWVKFKQTSSVVSKITTTWIQNVIIAGAMFLNPSWHAEEPKLVASVENKPVPASVEVATNDTKLASLSVNTVNYLEKIMSFSSFDELYKYCQMNGNMPDEAKKQARERLTILRAEGLRITLSAMTKEEMKTWCLNPDNAWAKNDPYKTIVTAQYNSAESSVGVEGGVNKVPRVVAVGEKAPLNESAEEKRAREEEERKIKTENREKERLKKELPKLVDIFNRNVIDINEWIAIKPGIDPKNDAKVKLSKSNDSIKAEKERAWTQWYFEFIGSVPAWIYEIELDIVEGSLMCWWEGGGRTKLEQGKTTINIVADTGIKIWGYVTVLKPSLEIKKITLIAK